MSKEEQELLATKVECEGPYRPDPELFISSGSVMLNLALSGTVFIGKY